MKKNYKFLSVALASALCASTMVCGCSKTSSSSATSQNKSTGNVTLSVYSSAIDEPIENALKTIVSDFEKENSSIKIDLNFPGTDYENILKVKMASNTLPDIFDTHGWAKVRYGNYLADLKDCPWASDLSDSAKEVVTDDSGKVYCLPMITAMDGLLYNADMFDKYNIEVPKTVDELTAAAEKIKKETNGSCEPFFMSGVDSVAIAQYLDIMSTPLLISPSNNKQKELKDNTYDFASWSKLPETLLDWKNKGLCNSDMLTAKASDLVSRLATGKCCFTAYFLTIADAVKSVNPDVHIGIMPFPVFDESDTPSFSGGERYTMGVWKDTPNLDASKTFVNFVAGTKELANLVDASKEPAGIKNVTVDNEYQEYFDKYASSRVFPYFDREYLPNGMYDVMSKNGAKLMAGQLEPTEFAKIMKSENDRLAGK